jgi:hypothetical protein
MSLGILEVWSQRDLVPLLFGRGLGYIFYDEAIFHRELPGEKALTDFGFYNTLLLEVGLFGLLFFLYYMFSELRESYKLFKRAEFKEKRYYFLAHFSYVCGCIVVFAAYYHYVAFFVLGLAAFLKRKLMDDCGVNGMKVI